MSRDCQAFPETVRHTVREKVRTLRHSEQRNLVRIRRIALSEDKTYCVWINSSNAAQKRKERRTTLGIPDNLDSTDGPSTQKSMAPRTTESMETQMRPAPT